MNKKNHKKNQKRASLAAVIGERKAYELVKSFKAFMQHGDNVFYWANTRNAQDMDLFYKRLEGTYTKRAFWAMLCYECIAYPDEGDYGIRVPLMSPTRDLLSVLRETPAEKRVYTLFIDRKGIYDPYDLETDFEFDHVEIEEA